MPWKKEKRWWNVKTWVASKAKILGVLKSKLGKIELWKAKFKLNKNVIKSAKEIQKINLKNSKWIAKDAIKELTGEKFKKGWKEECCE